MLTALKRAPGQSVGLPGPGPGISGACSARTLPSLAIADINAAIEKRLFIGRIPAGTQEEEILSIYGAFGTIRDSRFVPDRNGNSYGIAFVSYDNWAAPHRALMETDGKKQLRGHDGPRQTLVASFAERTGTVGRGGGAAYAKGLPISRLFVGSLPEDTTVSELMVRFCPFGSIEGTSLLPAKSRLRCGFVNFQIWGEALDAIERLDGEALREGGEPMSVMLAQPRDTGLASPRSERTDLGRPSTGPAWTLSNISTPDATKRRRMEAPAVELASQLATYITAVQGSTPRVVCNALHEQLMDVRDKLKVQSPVSPVAAPLELGESQAHAVPHPASQVDEWRTSSGREEWSGLIGGCLTAAGQRPSPAATSGVLGAGSSNRDAARLFVGGLPHDCTDEDLASLAAQLTFVTSPEASHLLECRVLVGRGCGYLRYASWEAAEEAFVALQSRQVEGWPQVLRVQWASPRVPQPEMGTPCTQQCFNEVGLDGLCFATRAEIEAHGLEPTRLFIGQIAREADVTTYLRPLFEAYGELQEFRWLHEKGILYITYQTVEEAQAAMQALSNFSMPGITKGLNVRFSQRRY